MNTEGQVHRAQLVLIHSPSDQEFAAARLVKRATELVEERIQGVDVAKLTWDEQHALGAVIEDVAQLVRQALSAIEPQQHPALTALQNLLWILERAAYTCRFPVGERPKLDHVETRLNAVASLLPEAA